MNSKEQRAARAARDERLTGKLFMSDAECQLRAENHAECSRANIKDHGTIKKHGDALVAQMQPVIAETTLSAKEIVELRRAMAQASIDPAEAEARRTRFIADARKGTLRPHGSVAAQMDRVKQAAHASPALRQALNVGNAAHSVPLSRALLRRVEDGQPILKAKA